MYQLLPKVICSSTGFKYGLYYSLNICMYQLILQLYYSCSVTMINIVKKYPGRIIHELNILIGCSDNCQSQAHNKYTVKNHLLQNNYPGCFGSFVKFCVQNFHFCRNEPLNPNFVSLKILPMERFSDSESQKKKIIDQS